MNGSFDFFDGQMSQRGVWQLRKLVVKYCNWGGSSRGIRYMFFFLLALFPLVFFPTCFFGVSYKLCGKFYKLKVILVFTSENSVGKV